MNRRERSKQKKKKAREERVRQKKLEPTLPLGEARRTTAVAVGATTTDVVIPAPRSVDAPRPDASAAALDNFFQGEPAEQWLKALLAAADLNPIVRTLDPA